MPPERWQQIRDVLEKALELAPEQRSAFLNQACSADPALRQEVETLLASNDRVRSSFLESPTPPVTLTPGTKLGEYEIMVLLGSGGMGEVYRARDARLGREVAIKVLPTFFAADSGRLRRFEQEARAAAALNHPNILSVHQLGTHQGAPYLVSELLEGETLRGLLKRGRLVVVRKAIDYGVQIARGLAAAHEKGIVHRDLKPENLFVTKDGRVKILDFGLAKLMQRQRSSDPGAPTFGMETERGMVMGTVGYMAPEQVRGETADHRADIFSFGAILYEMLAGTRAFQKPTSPETMTAILNEDPPSISQVTTNIPAALQRVVYRCLEKNPEQRFQSASDLAFALDALSESSAPAVAAGSGASAPIPHGFAFTSRQAYKWALASLLVVALALGAVLYSNHRGASQTSPLLKTTHRQFTFVGNAYDPAISPDGTLVAYVAKAFGEPQRLTVQDSGGSTLELARGTFIGRPRWSPDGSEVLFFGFEPAPYKSEPKAKGAFVVSRLGGVVRHLAYGPYNCWLTPDGSQLVTGFQSERSGFKGIRLVNKLGEEKEIRLSDYVWLADVDCSLRTSLILTVTKNSGKYQLRIVKPDGTRERVLLEETDQIDSARWSPGGDSIYYLHEKGSTAELSKVSLNAADARSTTLASGLQTGDFFSVSADGAKLAYTREDDTSNLWRVALTSAGGKPKAELTQLTSGTSYYGAPSFSPDGRWIAFPLGPNSYETNIFKMQSTGGRPVQLTFFEHNQATSPAWSPDGQRIAFICDQDGTRRVWTVDANGGTPPRSLSRTNASDTNGKLAWWPSRDIVYQAPGLRNFLRLDEQSQAGSTLLQQPESVGWVPGKPVFSPDGERMAVNWNRSDAGLWIVSFNPYSESLVLAGYIHPLGWSPDGRYVYATRGDEQQREVIRVQVMAPHEVISVATLPNPVELGNGTVSIDGQEIVVSVLEEKSDVWVMENFDPSAPRTETQPR